MKHTPEPWEFVIDITDTPLLITPKGEGILRASPASLYPSGDLKHAAACVNACEGINPEAVPDMLEALQYAAKNIDIKGQVPPWYMPVLDAIDAAITKATPEPEEGL